MTKFIPISWQQFEKDAIQLAKKIQEEYGRIDEIVAIARGGIVLARILSDILDAKISFLTIASYNHFSKTQEPTIQQPLTKQFAGERILLVDELVESGATLQKGIEYLQKMPIKSLITACLYVKPKTTYTPHFLIKKLDGWIILPYELRETKATFIEKVGFEKAKKKLKELSITDWSEIK